ncbi:DICT sensory domain-containing protein [Dolichospermum circinale]|uniref:DICT sensory domain-containing protein n=1 Tax=Dolichospermum circinale TaxID=109265 RepID=UPI00048373EA|nr:DICT sensory domain-containing protein [Dolichospermum circinale]MDB9453212.1 DICT sensory domain-containing protein [Dolichospermum circinale CS-541/06]MDB9462788.1 DICT sensory domain-containing protein [Dolichospermum circinale CS-541/04]MDB9474746.1 DICT sensory domain-containing protein [Dolichospermum circinale CS-537/11]MDB9478702.1 DICT sensory domain-containing protein [Dolichospermum circinale CS-537/03]MDB9489279.1 DICT sensory domain-containing protein [Dolichospermum circinale 
MSISTSVLSDLLKSLPYLRPQLYFKASLTALSHAIEDQVLAANLDQPLIIASFQKERFYRQEAHRYQRLGEKSKQVYVLSAPETEFAQAADDYEKIAFEPDDGLTQEWHLVVVADNYSSCLICRESLGSQSKNQHIPEMIPSLDMDTARRFEGIWTSEKGTCLKAAQLLLNRIKVYRPDLARKVDRVKQRFRIGESFNKSGVNSSHEYACDIDTDPFVQRLVTYLQASQYKLHKAYRSIAAQARKERLVNSISTAIRRSLDPREILEVAAQELGQQLQTCRCLIYRAQSTDGKAIIEHEFLNSDVTSVLGQSWELQHNPLFQQVVERGEGVYVVDTQTDSQFKKSATLSKIVRQFGVRSWLIEPVLYQGRLLGIVELHHCHFPAHEWQPGEVDLVQAIATQIGAALIQAESFANLEELNQQLEALDRTRRNLIAITGHELRTPLSTIQVCLESLAVEPDMPRELQQVMLNTALSDSERMRKLVQDFLTLSNLESGRVEWHPESLTIQECVDLALSRLRTRSSQEKLPQIKIQIPQNLPLVRADGDWLVEVLAKLIDNACKFTPASGKITINAISTLQETLEVIISDTGRGIEPNCLEIVFDRFYQEEGALRRTTGGTGLGLAICRQIVNGWGGKIWAQSAGKDQGSQLHFTIPIVLGS